MHFKTTGIKKILFVLFFFTMLGFVGQGQTITKLDRSKITFVSLDKKIQSLMKAANVQGLAISIFNNNESVYKNTFGYKRFDTREALKNSIGNCYR